MFSCQAGNLPLQTSFITALFWTCFLAFLVIFVLESCLGAVKNLCTQSFDLYYFCGNVTNWQYLAWKCQMCPFQSHWEVYLEAFFCWLCPSSCNRRYCSILPFMHYVSMVFGLYFLGVVTVHFEFFLFSSYSFWCSSCRPFPFVSYYTSDKNLIIVEVMHYLFIFWYLFSSYFALKILGLVFKI